MRRVRRLLFVVLGAFCGGYVAICGLFFAAQRSILFPAPESVVGARDGSTRIDVPNGTFFAWHPAKTAGLVVVHFHSNGDQVSFLSWLGQEWNREGVSFAAVEYPGYPDAAGTPTEQSIDDAAEAALRHLTGAMKIDRSRIVLVGQSLGTGVAIEMAARGWGVKLVLISPYTSWVAVVAHAFPFLPTQWLVRDRFDSETRARDVKVPTLIIHGTKDTIVPFEQGERVSQCIDGATFVAVEGGHHHDVLEWGATGKTVQQFVLH